MINYAHKEPDVVCCAIWNCWRGNGPSQRAMPRCDRAAQFAPFAALSGFDETVQEAGRLTQAQIELAENEREALNDALVRLAARLPEQPEVRLTYFQPDAKKSGGTYRTILTRVRRLDANAQVLVLTDGTRIPFDALLSIC